MCKKKEKRLKVKGIRVRVSDEKFDAFTQYSKDKNLTKTKILDDFLTELLKDYLGDK